MISDNTALVWKFNDTKECHLKCAYDGVYSCIYHMFYISIFCCTTSYSTYVHLIKLTFLLAYLLNIVILGNILE